MFKGILIEKDEAGYRAAVKDIDEAQLPEGDVTVRVSHSTLNYKDALVITGKGKRGPDIGPIPHRMGVLRHQVPQWLRQPPLGPATLQVTEAHLKHGGSGAFYVYLRRR